MPSSTQIPREIFRSPPTRRALAAALFVLCFGGLVLHRVDSPPVTSGSVQANTVRFSGPGVQGRLSLSHGKVDLSDERPIVFAEYRLTASPVEGPVSRAPLAMAVVVDTSGSMSGTKLEEAKRSVMKLIDGMDPDDQISLVSYSDVSRVMQPLARVRAVRSALRSSVLSMGANGGTNIHDGLSRGLRTLQDAPEHSAKRVVLVSDGLDSTREETVRVAHLGAERGSAISALGIGLDFDEGYLAAVAQAGHGNFGFVRDASSLASFLSRELRETAETTVRDVVANMKLPVGVRVAGVVGAHVEGERGNLRLRIGSLRPGAERRVVLKLMVDASQASAVLNIGSDLTWLTRQGESVARSVETLAFETTTDSQQMFNSRNPSVFASAVSAFASRDQLRAAEAYRRGDQREAERLIAGNLAALREAEQHAPKKMKRQLSQQSTRYRSAKRSFRAAPPSSEAGRAAAKSAVQSDSSNLGGVTF